MEKSNFKFYKSESRPENIAEFKRGNGMCKLGFENTNAWVKLDDVLNTLSYYKGGGYGLEIVNSIGINEDGIVIFEFEPKFNTVSVLVHERTVISIMKAEK